MFEATDLPCEMLVSRKPKAENNLEIISPSKLSKRNRIIDLKTLQILLHLLKTFCRTKERSSMAEWSQSAQFEF